MPMPLKRETSPIFSAVLRAAWFAPVVLIVAFIVSISHSHYKPCSRIQSQECKLTSHHVGATVSGRPRLRCGVIGNLSRLRKLGCFAVWGGHRGPPLHEHI